MQPISSKNGNGELFNLKLPQMYAPFWITDYKVYQYNRVLIDEKVFCNIINWNRYYITLVTILGTLGRYRKFLVCEIKSYQNLSRHLEKIQYNNIGIIN